MYFMAKPLFSVLLALIFYFSPFYIQGQDKADSLYTELKKAKHDTSRVNIYNELCYELAFSNLELALIYGKKGLELSYNIKYSKGIAYASLNMGVCYFNLGQTKKSLKYNNIALFIFDKLNNKEGIANAYNNLGILYYSIGNTIKALNYYQKALNIYYLLNKKNGIARCHINIGVIYHNQKNHLKALEYYYKSLAIFELINDNKNLVTTYNNIGGIYLEYGHIKKALYYHYKALKISKEINFKLGIVNSNLNIGQAYENLKNYDKALLFYKKTYALLTENDYKILFLDCLNDLSELYIIQNKYDTALIYAKQAYEIFEKTNFYEQQKTNFKNLSIIFENLGNYHNSLKFNQKYINIKDSLASVENQKQLIELEAKYEAEKIEKELLNKKTKLALLEKNKEIEFYKRWALAGLILAGLITIFLLRKRIRTNKDLYENKVKYHENQKYLSELQIKKQNLKIEQLKQEISFKEKDLKYKEQELVNLILHIREKNDFLEKLKNKYIINESDFNPDELKKLIDINLFNLEKDRKEFDAFIESASHDFFINIRKLLPEISRSEERLAVLLRLNLTSQGIADILNISRRSVELSRYRLRKKLNLTKEDNLIDFLKKL